MHANPRNKFPYEGGTLDVFGTKVAIAPEGEGKTLALQVFLDKSIMEVFINGGSGVEKGDPRQ